MKYSIYNRIVPSSIIGIGMLVHVQRNIDNNL